MKFDIHSLFTLKYTQWISAILILFFSVLILFEYATLIISPVSIQPLPESKKEVQVITREHSENAVSNSSLFGIYVSKNLNASSVKKSMLNVSLVGILYANTLNNSQVIIRSAGGDEKTYKTGDKIPGDAVIKRIMMNGILVERHGALESLSLPKNELLFEPVAKPIKGE